MLQKREWHCKQWFGRLVLFWQCAHWKLRASWKVRFVSISSSCAGLGRSLSISIRSKGFRFCKSIPNLPWDGSGLRWTEQVAKDDRMNNINLAVGVWGVVTVQTWWALRNGSYSALRRAMYRLEPNVARKLIWLFEEIRQNVDWKKKRRVSKTKAKTIPNGWCLKSGLASRKCFLGKSPIFGPVFVLVIFFWTCFGRMCGAWSF